MEDEVIKIMIFLSAKAVVSQLGFFMESQTQPSCLHAKKTLDTKYDK